MFQPTVSSPTNSPTCKNSSGRAAATAPAAEKRVVNIKNTKDLNLRTADWLSIQRRKGGSGGGGEGASGGDGGSPLSLVTSDTSSFSISTNTSPLNPCLKVVLVLVVLSMSIQSVIQLNSPLAIRQQQQSLRKATTEQAISVEKTVQDAVNNAKKSLPAGEKQNLYITIPPRAKGIVPDIVQPSDFIYYTPPDGGVWTDWDSAPIVIEKYKLVFFTTAKVGCTVWKQLFRRIMGYKDWKSQDNGLPHDPSNNGLRYLSHYSLADASRFMTDPTWTRAIMVRDPKSRFLSAFLDKAVSNDHAFLRDGCCKHNLTCIDQAQTIPGFLKLAAVCSDGHWRRQHERVDSKFWPYMDFVLHLETAAKDARELLQHVGAWEEFGKSGWASDTETGKSLAIFESKDIQGAGEHVTHSELKHWLYYTPESELDVEAFYQVDYENPLFHFSRNCLTCITNETTTNENGAALEKGKLFAK